MSKASALAKDPRFAGFAVGTTIEAELEDEVFSAPTAEQPARFAAYIRQKRLAAEERAQQRIDALIDEAAGDDAT
jgi:hypothetical protein